MYVLDTNILEYYLGKHKSFPGLTERIDAADELQLVSMTVVNAQEILRHAISPIKDQIGQKREKILNLYEDLQKVIKIIKRFPVLPYDYAAYECFLALADLQTTIGSRDRRIAAIALANDAIVITENIQHFEIVPGLVVESWKDNEAAHQDN